jgi:hypothetical protein
VGIRGKADIGQAVLEGGEARETGVYCCNGNVNENEMMVVNESCRGKNTMW